MTPRDRIRSTKLQHEVEGYLELGLADRALKTLHRLGDPVEYDPHATYLWGEALRMLHRYEDAIVPLIQAAEALPENLHIATALGWCYKRIGQIDLAIESLDRALISNPTEALLHYNLACYWSLAGGKQQALECLSEALHIEPNYRLLIDDESDFDPIRFDPDFQELCDRTEARG